MAFNGSGTFSLVAGNPVVTGTTISSTWANNTLSDIATNGLTNCITKDGQTTVTANIPLGGFKITGLGGGTAVSDAPRVSQVQNASFTALTGVSGASTITASATPTPAAYVEGQRFAFTAVAANAASPTLNVSGLGANLIFWNGSTATASTWNNGNRIEVVYLSTSQSTASATGFHVVGHTGFIPQSLLQIQTIVPSQFGNITKNFVLAGPATASASAPAFRALVSDDLPTLSGAQSGLTLISLSSASNSATIDFTSGLTSTYDEYLFVLSDILCATDAQQLNIRVSQDGGGTYKSGASDYNYNFFLSTDGGAVTPTSANTSVIAVAPSLSNTKPLSAWVTLSNPSNSSRVKIFKTEVAFSPSGGTVTRLAGIGILTLNTTAINGVRFFMGSGNITSGTIALYGLRKA